MLTFKGRNAIVTGAGGGIGLACAVMLAECGVHVTAADLKDRPEELAGFGDQVSFVRGDITEGDIIAECKSRSEAAGGVDYLVTSAGVFPSDDGSMLEIDRSTIDRVMRINAFSAVDLARETLALLRQSPAPAMVHVASMVGLRNMENIFEAGPSDAYQLSKAAMVSASRSLAVQLARDGIRCNTVCPGSVVSPMTEAIYADPERVRAMEARTPLGRIGRPEDVAGACLYLLSDQASFVTGIDLLVDGGQMAKL
jgi:NAD(P)-dependent dehydrogenase (short-subunit alcohol dehydrogenase family)